jgi:protein arginine N-methyltransferase 1
MIAAAEPPSPPAYHASDQYLEEYGTLYDHLGMLSDHERMRAYHDAIRLNAEAHFKGKVVLDVGTGTGILAIWAAQAGARRVFAVEGTSVAQHAETMAKAHGFGGVIEVLRGRMEDVTLPEPVDVIVSEWMGYFLLRESMIHSVIYARDKWMREGGVMYPSSARLLLASLQDAAFVEERQLDSQDAMRTWDASADEMKSRYGLDFGALRKQYEQEHHTYTYRQAWQGRVPSSSVGHDEVELLHIDMHNVTKEELFGWTREIELADVEHAQGVVGYFDVRFCGHATAPATECVELTTSPHAPPTHWGQSGLLLDPLATRPALRVGLESCRRSHHDLNFTMWYQAAQGEPRHASYSISNDFRGYAELSSDQGEADAEAEGGAEAGESPYSPEAAYDYEDDEAD